MKTSATVIVLLLAASSLARAADTVNLHEPAVITKPFWGCAKWEDWEKVISLALQGHDIPASKRYGAEHCVMLAPGTQVMPEDTAYFSPAICVRPMGTADCLWTARMFVSPKKP